MGWFRSSSRMIPTPEHIRKCRTVKDGEWWLGIRPADSGINFLAMNNEYSEWLWTVEKHGFVFNALFGGYIKRLETSKRKYQKWIDKKNASYIHSVQVAGLID